MIVVDTSVFLDELFRFNQKRHDKARKFSVEAYYLLDEFEKVKEKMQEL